MTIASTTSLAITFLLLAISAYLLLRKQGLPRAAVPGVDLFARTFVELGGRAGDPLLAGVTWLLLSSLVGFGIPVLTGKGQFILEPSELVITLDYCLFVPMLLGAYIFLIRSLACVDAINTKNTKTTSDLQKSKGFWIYQVLLVAVSLVIQFQAIYSELQLPSPCSPWVALADASGGLAWPCSGKGASGPVAAPDLSLAGVFYYALRGLDTFMALGLVATITAAWFGLRTRFKGQTFVDFCFPGLGPSETIRNVGTGLLAAILFGSLITALHGLSLFAHAEHLGGSTGKDNSEQQVRLFTHSTWAIWVVLTVVTSAFATAIVLGLRRAVLAELRHLQEAEIEKYVRYEGYIGQAPQNIAEAKAQADYVEKALAVRDKIAAAFALAETWPLPAGAIAAVSVAALSQVANVAAAVYTFTTRGISLPH